MLGTKCLTPDTAHLAPRTRRLHLEAVTWQQAPGTDDRLDIDVFVTASHPHAGYPIQFPGRALFYIKTWPAPSDSLDVPLCLKVSFLRLCICTLCNAKQCSSNANIVNPSLGPNNSSRRLRTECGVDIENSIAGECNPTRIYT